MYMYSFQGICTDSLATLISICVYSPKATGSLALQDKNLGAVSNLELLPSR